MGKALPDSTGDASERGRFASPVDGRFVLGGLEPGPYSVDFSHPYMEPFAYIPRSRDVRVSARAGAPARIGFSAPSVARIVRGMCRQAERPEPRVEAVREIPADGIAEVRGGDE